MALGDKLKKVKGALILVNLDAEIAAISSAGKSNFSAANDLAAFIIVIVSVALAAVGVRLVVNLVLELTDEGKVAGLIQVAEASLKIGHCVGIVVRSWIDNIHASDIVLVKDGLEIILLQINCQVAIANLGVKVIIHVSNVVKGVRSLCRFGILSIIVVIVVLFFISRFDEAGLLLRGEEACTQELRHHL